MFVSNFFLEEPQNGMRRLVFIIMCAVHLFVDLRELVLLGYKESSWVFSNISFNVAFIFASSILRLLINLDTAS